MSEMTNLLKKLMDEYGVKPVKAHLPDYVEQRLIEVGPVPPSFMELYSITNGLEYEWFRILPLSDSDNPKKTWDSLERANDPATTEFLGGDEELLKRFLVFAEIGDGECAVLDRSDQTIWYQDDELHQTDLSLEEFIQYEFKEVSDM